MEDNRSTEAKQARPLGQPAGKTCNKCGEMKVWKRHKASKHGAQALCLPCHVAITSKWNKQNPEKARKNRTKWEKENHEKNRERKRKWHKANPEKRRARNSRRRARKLAAETDGLVYSIGEHETCSWCLVHPATDVDHIVPLAKGGSDLITNKTGACDFCNSSKHARVYPGSPGWEDWLRSRRGQAAA